MRKPKKQKKPLNDLSRSLTPFDPNQTLIIVVPLTNVAPYKISDATTVTASHGRSVKAGQFLRPSAPRAAGMRWSAAPHAY